MNRTGTSDRRPTGGARDLLLPVAALVVLVALAHLAATRWESWQNQLAALGPLRPVVYLVLWLGLVPCGFPAAALGLTAGFLFGIGGGSLWAICGLCASGLLMHGLGRRWFGPRVERALAGQPRLERLRRAAAEGGVKLHLLARLSPLNYALVSYTLAAGGATLRPYLAGLAGAVPGLLAYVWLGAAAAAGTSGPMTARRAVVALGGIALVLLVALVARRLGRAAEDPDEPPAGLA